MQANVKGRVKNISLSKIQGLLPLYETVINSIEAIEDAGKSPEAGEIEIRILRECEGALPLQSNKGGDHRSRSPITCFEVIDNGVGFTENNYAAFNEADTQIKSARGGKGVGRFLWLKAFNKVEIDSIFKQNGDFRRRTFEFSLAHRDGVNNHSLKSIIGKPVERTVVRLIGFNEDFAKYTPRSGYIIAQRIIEHCLEYFVLNRMPLITLNDQEENEPIILKTAYDQMVGRTEIDLLDIKGNGFKIIHFMLRAHSDLKHNICYCANSRVIKIDKIGNKIANLPSVLTDEEEPDSMVYAGYVSSDYLNIRVNQERTEFVTFPEDGHFDMGELTWKDIEESILSASKRVLEPYTEKTKVEKNDRLRNHVNNKSPEYRHILRNHPDRLDEIPPDVSEENLDKHLYEIHKRIETGLKEEAEAILKDDSFETYKEKMEKFNKWWEDFNDVGKANLARYIVNRKVVLNFLEKALKMQESGKYSKEEIIHQIIFPIRKTSDEIAYEKHNLWIIDEKLSYHQYLASDIPLNKIEILENDSSLRPDLLIFFEYAIAVVDEEAPYNSGFVIFEFKRPMRGAYEKDPIDQVLGYVEDIKREKALTKDGRPLNVQRSTPFYCYIVCDPTEEIKKSLKFKDLRPTPDNLGFFGYNSEVGAYIEVISFDKLLSDAKKRNRILFEKLNLPGQL